MVLLFFFLLLSVIIATAGTAFMAVARNVAVAIDSIVTVERRIAVVREGGGTLVALGGQLVRS